MTLPVPSEMTAAVGAILTAAEWNSNVRDAVNFLTESPLCICYQQNVQSIPNAAEVPISFDTNTIDTYGGHSATNNNARYTAVVAGWYLIVGQVYFGSNATGGRQVQIYVNGNAPAWAPADRAPSSGAGALQYQADGLVYLNVGDYVQTVAYQSSGGAMSTVAGSSMTVLWVHA